MDQTYKQIVAPLLGTRLGKLNQKALAYLETIKSEKQNQIKKELEQLNDQNQEIIEEISNLPAENNLNSEQREFKLKELAKVKALIEEKRKEMGKPFLGIFPAGQIKNQLTNIFAQFAGRLASYKSEVDSPKIIANFELGAIEAQQKMNKELTKRKAAQAEYVTSQREYGKITSELEKAEEYEENQKNLSAQKTFVSGQILSLGEKLEDVSTKFSSKIDKVSNTFENLATTLNKIDVFIRGLMAGARPNYDNVGGLTQSPVATIEALKDMPVLNQYVQNVLQYVAEGKELSVDLKQDKDELKQLTGKAKKIAIEESENEKRLSEQRNEKSELDDRSKRERSEHRKLIDEIAGENVKRVKEGIEVIPNPIFNPTELNNELNIVKGKISELEQAKKELESKNTRNFVEQNLLKSKVSKLEEEIQLNKKQLGDYLTRIEKIISKYGVEAIRDYEFYSTSPFDVRINQKNLEEVENIKQSR